MSSKQLHRPDEKTPLMEPSPGVGQEPSPYYFRPRSESHGSAKGLLTPEGPTRKSAGDGASSAPAEGAGEDTWSARGTIEILPKGATVVDFQSRPVLVGQSHWQGGVGEAMSAHLGCQPKY